MVYGVIIAGGSFAGLAVARELRRKILLIDEAEIGTSQTSACATLVDVLQKLDCEDLILRTFDPIFINVLGKDIAFKFGYSFCTFDYRVFCQIMLKSIEAEIIKAKVKGVKGNSVVTDKGEFEGEVLVDAAGWRAILANFRDIQMSVDKKQRGFIQTDSSKSRPYLWHSENKKRLSFWIL